MEGVRQNIDGIPKRFLNKLRLRETKSGIKYYDIDELRKYKKILRNPAMFEVSELPRNVFITTDLKRPVVNALIDYDINRQVRPVKLDQDDSPYVDPILPPYVPPKAASNAKKYALIAAIASLVVATGLVALYKYNPAAFAKLNVFSRA